MHPAHRLLAPKHLLATFAIALLVGALGTGVIGAATAEDEIVASMETFPAASIFIPAPASGDVLSYDWTEVPAEPLNGSAVNAAAPRYQQINVTIGAQRDQLDGHGTTRSLVEVKIDSYADAVPRTEESYLDMSDGMVYLLQTWSNTTQTMQPNLPMVNGSTISNTYRFQQFTDAWGHHQSPACEIGTIFGKELALQAPTPMERGCIRSEPMIWIPVLVLEEADSLVVVFEEQDEFGTTFGRIWMRDGFAYPVRTEWPAQDTFFQWNLQTFTAGDKPIMLDVPQQIAVPETTYGGTHVLPFTDEDAALAWALSDAWAVAALHPEAAPLQAFLIEHPESYVAQAFTQAQRFGGMQLDIWHIHVADGQDVLPVRMERTRMLAVDASELDQYSYSFEESDVYSPFGNVPLADRYDARDTWPEAFPTMGSLLAKWALYATAEYEILPANSFGYALAKDFDGQGGTPGLYVQAGTANSEVVNESLSLAGLGEQSYQISHIAWYDDLGFVARLDEFARQGAAPTASTPVSTPSGEKAGKIPTQVREVNWVVPTPAQAAGITVGAIFVAMAYWLSPLGKSGLIGLFSRVRDDKLLEHPRRRAIMDAVEGQPGIHYSGLLRLLETSKGGLEHHLRKMQQAGLVKAIKNKGQTSYFPAQGQNFASQQAMAHLQSAPARAVLEVIRSNPGIAGSGIAQSTGLSPQTVSYHVGRLAEAGLVDKQRMGRSHLHHPTSLALEALEG